jgi:ATP synthase protein I
MNNFDREEERGKEEVRHAWGISFLRFGIIGFIIITPTLIGAILGMFLDAAIPGMLPWSVVLMILGIACGFYISWSWLVKEIRRSKEAG